MFGDSWPGSAVQLSEMRHHLAVLEHAWNNPLELPAFPPAIVWPHTSEVFEALTAGANLQHLTSEQFGEVDCTEHTPCIFCVALGRF